MAKDGRNATSEDLRQDVLDKINSYKENGFAEAERLHEVIMSANPCLCPRLWYGMPGYAKTKDSAVLCFFRKDSLISFGFTESVDMEQLNQDGASMTPSAWYITKLDDEAEKQITKIVETVIK